MSEMRRASYGPSERSRQAAPPYDKSWTVKDDEALRELTEKYYRTGPGGPAELTGAFDAAVAERRVAKLAMPPTDNSIWCMLFRNWATLMVQRVAQEQNIEVSEQE